MDIAVTNAYILHKMSLSENDSPKHDHKTSVADLINELADAGSVVPTLSTGQGRIDWHITIQEESIV